MLHPLLASYVRAWARHRIVIALASQDAAVRAGLTADETVQIFGVACVTVGPYGVCGLSGLPDHCPVDVIVNDPALIYRFPYGYPDAARRGMLNDEFLSPHWLTDRVLPLLAALGSRVRIVVIHPLPEYRTEGFSTSMFLSKLDAYLAPLPHSWRYAIDTANAEYLQPAYCDFLRHRGVAPVISEGDGILQEMPSLSDQLFIPGICVPPFSVVRSTIRCRIPGMVWHRTDAVIRRQGWCDAVRRCLALSCGLYLLIDDERDPLQSLALLMEMLNDDLAQRSPIKTMAA